MSTKKNKKKKRKFHKPLGIPKKEVEFVIENLALLLSSGVSITEAINSVAIETKSKALSKVLIYVKDKIDEGTPLYRAFGETKILSDNVLHLIKLGEQSGRLPENLRLIAAQQEKNRNFRSKVRAAMMYPVIVFIVAIVVGTGIAWFVLPNLTKVFFDLRVDLPIVTRWLISIGDALKAQGYLIVPGIWVGFSLLFYLIFVNRKSKVIGQFLLLKTPGVSRLVKSIELARFGYVMGSLLSAGIPLITALDFLIESTTLRRYKKFYSLLRQSLFEGNSFRKFFEKKKNLEKYLPLSLSQMIVAGEASGNLAEVFERIGEIYQEKADLATKNLPTIIEPVLLFLVWLVVAFIAFAIIMPIYGLIGEL